MFYILKNVIRSMVAMHLERQGATAVSSSAVCCEQMLEGAQLELLCQQP